MPPDTTAPAFRWASILDVPRAVWALTALLAGLLLAWSLIAPIFDAPDEPQHTDLVLEVRETWRYPAYDDLSLTEQMVEALRVSRWSETGHPLEQTRGPVTAPEAPPRQDRPSFEELGSRQQVGFVNPAPQHPPLYYLQGAVWLLAIPGTEGLAYDQVVWLLRLLSILTLLPLPALTFVAAQRLTGRRGPALAAAAVLPAAPMLTHIGSAVSNDNLLTLAVAILTVLLVHVATGDLTRRTAVWVGVVTGSALLVKGFALFAPLWIASAYLIAWTRTRRRRPAAEGTVAAGAVAATIGGWWWAANLLRFGTLQPTVQELGPPPAGFEPRLAAWFDRAWYYLLERFWGSFGWVDVSLHREIVTTAAWTLAILIALAFVVRRPEHRWWRADLILLLVPVLSILGIIGWGSWQSYTDSDLLVGVQGRYLLPGLPGMAIIVTTGLSAVTRRFDRWLPLLALAAAGYMHWMAGRIVLFHYFGHPGIADPRISVPGALAWSPLPHALSLGFLLLPTLAGVWALVELVLSARRPDGQDMLAAEAEPGHA